VGDTKVDSAGNGTEDSTDRSDQVAKIDSITITGADTVFVGSSVALVPKVYPAGDVSDSTLLWSSNDTSVAIVDSNGVVTGKGKGTVTITATAQDGSEKKGDHILIALTLGEDEDEDGVPDHLDADIDGDGYLEVSTIEELDSVRYNSTASPQGLLGVDSTKGDQ
jgi:hypothetical protein